MDILREAATWLAEQMEEHCASEVEYRRGSEVTIVPAVFARTDMEVASEAGIAVHSPVWDFVVGSQNLGGAPRPGDIIAADGRRYEVAELAGGRCWRWTDQYCTAYRIHTRELGPDTAGTLT